MCPNNHDPDRMTVRPDGTRVCGACRDAYQRRNRMKGFGTGTVDSAVQRRDAGKANEHGNKRR